MASDWYKRNPRDFIDGVIGLELEEIGAYSVVLELIYLHNGPIRHDTKWLSGLFRCSTRKAGAIIARLIECGKLTLEDGRIGNRRAALEIQVRTVSDQVHAKNGRKGGELASENRRRAKENNDLSLPPKVPDKIRVDKNIAKLEGTVSDTARDSLFGESDAPEVAPPESLLAELMAIIGTSTIPGDAGDVLDRWKARGADPDEHIKPAVKRVTDRLRTRLAAMPTRLAYFDKAVQEEQDKALDERQRFIERMNRIAAANSLETGPMHGRSAGL